MASLIGYMKRLCRILKIASPTSTTMLKPKEETRRESRPHPPILVGRNTKRDSRRSHATRAPHVSGGLAILVDGRQCQDNPLPEANVHMHVSSHIGHLRLKTRCRPKVRVEGRGRARCSLEARRGPQQIHRLWCARLRYCVSRGDGILRCCDVMMQMERIL